MNTELINKLVQDMDIKKSDCDRLIGLINLISARQTRPLVKIIIPLVVLSSLGYQYSDAVLLQKIISFIDRSYSFEISNKSYFEKTTFEPKSFTIEEKSQLSQSLILSCYGSGYFQMDIVMEFIIEIKKSIEKNSAAIILNLDKNGLSRSINGKVLIYPIKFGTDRFDSFLAILNRGPIVGSKIPIRGKKKPPSICNDINRTAQKLLELPLDMDLIVNNKDGKGYFINSKYEIKR